MKGKIIFPALLCVALTGALVLSPYGVGSAKKQLDIQAAQETKMETYKRNVETAESMLLDSVNSFVEGRTFDVAYNDVSKIHEVLSKIAGIQVKDMEKVDPYAGFIESGYIMQGDTPAAVQFNLLTTDPTTAISVFDKMELPIYSVSWDSPNIMTVVVLTGGEV